MDTRGKGNRVFLLKYCLRKHISGAMLLPLPAENCCIDVCVNIPAGTGGLDEEGSICGPSADDRRSP
jgi:hypothetical protein